MYFNFLTVRLLAAFSAIIVLLNDCCFLLQQAYLHLGRLLASKQQWSQACYCLLDGLRCRGTKKADKVLFLVELVTLIPSLTSQFTAVIHMIVYVNQTHSIRSIPFIISIET